MFELLLAFGFQEKIWNVDVNTAYYVYILVFIANVIFAGSMIVLEC